MLSYKVRKVRVCELNESLRHTKIRMFSAVPCDLYNPGLTVCFCRRSEDTDRILVFNTLNRREIFRL